MIAFIDDHRGVHGVEPIREVLPIAPFTYHAHVAQRIDPTRCSARARRDATLMPVIERVFDGNFGAYGVRWFNHRKIPEPIGNIPPAAAEARYYAALEQPALAA